LSEIFKFAYPRELFDLAPEKHRVGFLLFGQLWNDSNILSRQLLTARTKPPEGRSDPDMHGQIATEFLNLRLLASRLSEGHELLKELGKFLPSWKEDLPSEAVSAVKNVRTYFNKSQAPLRLLRNKLGFHQDIDLATESLDGIADEELIDYRGRFYATTLFMSAEVLHLRALAILFEVQSSKEALAILAADALRMLGEFYEVCRGYHEWFMETHIIPTHSIAHGEKISLASAPAFDAIVTPFFVNFEKLKQQVDARAEDRDNPLI
jgi:hypothetical protein